MKQEFDNRLTYNQISFQYTKGFSFDEREIHTYHEILLCKSGNVTLFTDNFRQTVQKDTLVIIPKEHFHFLQINGDEPFERLKIRFNDPDDLSAVANPFLDRIRLIESPTGTMRFLLNEIRSALTGDADKKVAQLKAYGGFCLLLCQIAGQAESPFPPGRNDGHLVSKCIAYIDAHFSQKLTLENAAKALYVSPSALSHAFTKELGLPFHQYITQKRLIYAHRKIRQGQSPTVVYADCGYADYSTFYRAYKKAFGHSPSSK